MIRLKPPRLEPGMTIGLVSPASAARDVRLIDKGTQTLEKLGFKVTEGRHTRKRLGYLAAHDKARVADLNAMLSDPHVDAIMCIRGGYGCMRILPYLDYAQVQKTPKAIIGYSDITALHLALWRKCRLVTFNGPMLLSAFAKDNISQYTVESMMRVLGSPKPAGSIWQGLRERSYRVVRAGRATGQLIGGNLSLVAALVGTPYALEPKGAIVYLEEVDEKPYRIDRMLTQLILSGSLEGAVGIVFGRNVADDETAKLEAQRFQKGIPRKAEGFPNQPTVEYEQIIDDVIADRLKPLGIPVMIGLPFGHIDEYATLPLGIRATMDTRSGDLVLEEAAVQ
jgi:muramoyltetrapeptide carboxypeptidase